MSEYREMEERLAGLVPAAPRPELESEILGNVRRELRAVPFVRFAVAAVVLLAALVATEVQEAAHRQRVAALEADSVHPRVTRAIRELSPWLASDQAEIRVRLLARRRIDARWADYLRALHQAGGNHV